MARAWRHGAYCGLLLLGSVFAGCVSQEKYDALKFENERLRETNQQLAADLERERGKSALCAAELERVESNLTQAQSMLDALRKAADGDKQTIDNLMKQLNDVLAKDKGPIVIDRPVAALPEPLDRALRDFAAKYPDRVSYDPATGSVKFGTDLLFDLGEDAIRGDAQQSLADFAEIIKSPAAAPFDVIIVGHTDNVPIRKTGTKAKHPTNWHLSVHRAIAVEAALAGDGVDSSRMGVMGYGEFRPIAPNTASGNQANRRVEMFIVRKDSVGLSHGGAAPASPRGKAAPAKATPRTNAAPGAPAPAEPAGEAETGQPRA